MRLALAIVLLLPGCISFVGEVDIDPATVDVPAGLRVSDATYRAAYVYAAERVGRADFDRLYDVNRTLTGPAYLPGCAGDCDKPWFKPHDWVVFDVRTPVGDFGSVTLPFATNGTQVLQFDDQPYDGLPDCKARPRSCDFRVTEQEARAIARRDGLQERGCPFHVIAGWSAPDQRFEWQVQDQPCPEPADYELTSVYVDVSTGKVLGRGSSFMIAN